jgi:hypothetical protein
VWDAPAEHENNLLPVTHYVFSSFATGTDLASAASVDEVLLDLPINGGTWGGPVAGHFLTSLAGAKFTPGQDVNVAVRACNSLGCGPDSVSVTLGTLPDVPGHMVAPQLVSANSTSLGVGVLYPPSHAGGRAIERYEVRVTTQPALIDRTIDVGTSVPTSYVLTDRLLSHAYQLRVRAVNDLGAGEWSDELFVDGGAADLPSIPEGLAVDGATVHARGFSIEWDPPSTNSTVPLFYRLELNSVTCPSVSSCTYSSADARQSFVTLSSFNCTSGTCKADVASGISPSNAYNLRLSSVTSSGASLPSATAAVTTLADVPTLATPPAVTQVGEDFISFAWAPAQSNGEALTLHRAYACDVASGGCVSVTADADAVAATVPLPSGRNFTIAVEAVNSIGSTGNVTSTDGVHTTRAVPMPGYQVAELEPLPGLSAKTTMRVQWASPYGNGLPITGFKLNVDGEDRDVEATTTGASPQFTVVGLNPGSFHTFTVRAVNSLGEGIEGPNATFETAHGVPGTPAAPLLNSTSLDMIAIDCQPAPYPGGPPISGYELRLGHMNGTVSILPIPAFPDLAFEWHAPEPNSEYTFRSRAVNSLGAGEWSGELKMYSVAMSPPAAPPYMPGCFKGDGGGEGETEDEDGEGDGEGEGDLDDGDGDDEEGDGAGEGEIGITFSASGDVSDYDEAKKQAILEALAAEAGISAEGATIRVTGGSVVIEIVLIAGDQADTATAALEEAIATPEALTETLEEAGIDDVVATSAPEIELAEGSEGKEEGDGGEEDSDAGDGDGGEGSNSACGATEEGSSCAGPTEFCFYDADCLDVVNDPRGGLGCNAGGHAECRFCGFGSFRGIPCPGGSGDGLSEGELAGNAAGLTGAGSGAGAGAGLMAVGVVALAAAAFIVIRQKRRAAAAGGGKDGTAKLINQTAELEREVARLQAEQAAARKREAGAGKKDGDGGAAAKAAGRHSGTLAKLAMQNAQAEAALAMLEARIKMAAEGGDKKLMAKLAAEKAALEAKRAQIAGAEAEEQAKARAEASLLRREQSGGHGSGDEEEGGVGGDGGKDQRIHAQEGPEASAAKLRSAMLGQSYFEPGVDDNTAMEVNPVLLHDIHEQKKLAREHHATDGNESKSKKAASGAPATFGNTGGLARLNFALEKKSEGHSQFETLKSVQNYLSTTGVVGMNDKYKEHCTRPGAKASALSAAQALTADSDLLSTMSRAARQTRAHVRQGRSGGRFQTVPTVTVGRDAAPPIASPATLGEGSSSGEAPTAGGRRPSRHSGSKGGAPPDVNFHI